MCYKRILALLILTVSVISAQATTRYVKTSSSGSGNGSSWANASADLQAMINASSSGDEVWVATGVYYPTRNHLGNTNPANARTKTFLLKAGVDIYGGFAGNETSKAARNIYANPTTLSGNIGAANSASDNCYHVLLAVQPSVSTNGCTVDGFTVKDGMANSTGTDTLNNIVINHNKGGGVYAYSGVNTFQKMIVRNNYASYRGGGIYLFLGHHTIKHDTVHNNTSGFWGGGLGSYSADFVIDSNTFHTNNAEDGGGLDVSAFYDTTDILSNNAIYNNTAKLGGGFHVNHSTKFTISHNAIFNNSSSVWGGGAYFDGGNFTYYYVYNNAIFNNTSPSGGGIYVNDGDGTYINNTFLSNTGGGGSINLLAGAGTFTNNIFWKNSGDFILGFFFTNTFKNNILQRDSASYPHSNGGSVYAIGANASGNVYGYDPVFVNDTLPLGADGIPFTSDDGIALTSCSPAVNAAITPTPALPKDVLGNSRVNAYDIGAYEFQSTPLNVVLVPPINGVDRICLNDTTTFTNGVSGGVWFSSDTSIATVDSSTGFITGKDTGSINIYYKVGNNSCPSNIAHKQITVVPPPYAAPIVGNDTVCPGQTLWLTSASSVLGYWYSSNTSIATTQSSTVDGYISRGFIHGISSGSVTITFTVTTGCSRSQTKDIYVRNAPAVSNITGDTSLCVGDTVQLNNTTTGGIWSLKYGSLNSVNTSGRLISLRNGTNFVYYTITDSFGCTNSTNRIIRNNSKPYPHPLQGADSLCMFSSTTYSSPITGGTWLSSDTTIATVDTNGLISGIKNGQATIYYTLVNAAGCSTTVNKNIYIKSATAVDTISGPSTLCLNDSLLYTCNTSNGIWASRSNGSTAVIDTAGTLLANAAGNDTITYTVTNTSGCVTSSEKHITINAPHITQVTGVDSICVGDNQTFANTTTGGIWSNVDTNLGDVDTAGIYLAKKKGVDTIVYDYTSNGCPVTSVKEVFIQQQDTATITGNNAVCIDDSIQLSASLQGGIWDSKNNTIADIDTNGLVSAQTAGQATITYTKTNSLGCIGLSSYNVTVNEVITTTAQNGITVTATGNQSGAQFQWIDCSNNQPVAGATQSSYTATSNGQYAVVITYQNCTDTSICHTITGVGINYISKLSGLVISPNPAREYVYIQTKGFVAAHIKLFDITGKFILAVTPQSEQTSINIQSLPNGVYTLHIATRNKVAVEKLIIR